MSSSFGIIPSFTVVRKFLIIEEVKSFSNFIFQDVDCETAAKDWKRDNETL